MEITTISQAMQLHAQILKSNANPKPNNIETKDRDLTKLFAFTALSGNLTYAHSILNSLSTPNSYFYNTMIRAYANSSNPLPSLSLFLKMHSQNDMHCPKPDKFTYPFVLKSCAKLNKTHEGKQLHSLILKLGLASNQYIQHGLVHMYSCFGDLGCACNVFGKMSEKDVVSWTSMIDGFVNNDKPIEALRLFEEMLSNGIEPNDATFVSVLRASADTGALSVGQSVHSMVEEREIGLKANVSTALIDMYVKCGCIDSAKDVFHKIENKDVFTWTAIISGLASHGHCKDAIKFFHQMELQNVKPDERTVTAILSACRNAGWVHEGLSYFWRMKSKYGIRPTIHHYGCIVDLYGRAGHLDEAEAFINKMTIKPDVVLWRSLIWACKIHGDTDRAERLMKQVGLLDIEASDCGSYVLLGNVYAVAGKWDDKAKVRELMIKRGLSKPPGSSKIEIDGVIHDFTSGDSSHIDAEKIYEKLDEIEEQLRGLHYDPKVSEVLLEIDDDEKAFQLHHHSEKLAVAFGLIKTSSGTNIRIVKNLRSCEDCHSVMKLISRIYQRDIVMRDRIRFHHFRNGKCSCGDKW
ncbi:Pentatricopeptide repeat [Dillenia turbinata]|uniref:Pentatricopeptide repeat n=1 Tax=Dillenia turbinata TaxID=194707 RepID=A0AAN8WHU0_9MAGN